LDVLYPTEAMLKVYSKYVSTGTRMVHRANLRDFYQSATEFLEDGLPPSGNIEVGNLRTSISTTNADNVNITNSDDLEVGAIFSYLTGLMDQVYTDMKSNITVMEPFYATTSEYDGLVVELSEARSVYYTKDAESVDITNTLDNSHYEGGEDNYQWIALAEQRAIYTAVMIEQIEIMNTVAPAIQELLESDSYYTYTDGKTSGVIDSFIYKLHPSVQMNNQYKALMESILTEYESKREKDFSKGILDELLTALNTFPEDPIGYMHQLKLAKIDFDEEIEGIYIGHEATSVGARDDFIDTIDEETFGTTQDEFNLTDNPYVEGFTYETIATPIKFKAELYITATADLVLKEAARATHLNGSGVNGDSLDEYHQGQIEDAEDLLVDYINDAETLAALLLDYIEDRSFYNK